MPPVGSWAGGVFAGLPAAGAQVPVGQFQGFGFQGGGHRVVPAVEIAKQADHAQDLDDLALAPVRLQAHWSEGQIVEILGVVSLFGYFNRWNDSMATTLEPEPLELADRHLSASGWQPGKHAPGP